MFKKLKNIKAVVIGSAASLLAASQSYAAGIDVTEAVALIGDGKTATATIGGALLTLALIIVVYKCVRRQ